MKQEPLIVRVHSRLTCIDLRFSAQICGKYFLFFSVPSVPPCLCG